jgi:hypothetical protein
MEERDRDRLDLLAREEVDGRRDARRVEGRQDLPARPEALRDLAAPAARHERGRPLEVDVVESRQAQPPDLEEIAEARGREEPGARAAAFEDRVRGDRRPVQQLVDVTRGDPGRAHQLPRAMDDRLRVVGGGGEDLPRERSPVRSDQNQIGERAAHVDAQAMAHPVSPAADCVDLTAGQL